MEQPAQASVLAGKPKRSELRRWRRQERARANAKCEQDWDERCVLVKRSSRKKHFAALPEHFHWFPDGPECREALRDARGQAGSGRNLAHAVSRDCVPR